METQLNTAEDFLAYSGPFDLILSILAKRELDITEVALSEITDEYLEIISAQQHWDIDQASQFLVVASTILDLKTAKLLPTCNDDLDNETLKALEARDLLFARLLQYKAYKEVAQGFALRYERQSRRFARHVPLEPHLAAALPELVWSTNPEQLAMLMAQVLRRKHDIPQVSTLHLHDSLVSIASQVEIISQKLQREGGITFAQIVADAPSIAHVVSRFLAILELYRINTVDFTQTQPLAQITITWIDSSTDSSSNVTEVVLAEAE